VDDAVTREDAHILEGALHLAEELRHTALARGHALAAEMMAGVGERLRAQLILLGECWVVVGPDHPIAKLEPGETQDEAVG
jgi:hypothetical protein